MPVLVAVIAMKVTHCSSVHAFGEVTKVGTATNSRAGESIARFFLRLIWVSGPVFYFSSGLRGRRVSRRGLKFNIDNATANPVAIANKKAKRISLRFIIAENSFLCLLVPSIHGFNRPC